MPGLPKTCALAPVVRRTSSVFGLFVFGAFGLETGLRDKFEAFSWHEINERHNSPRGRPGLMRLC